MSSTELVKKANHAVDAWQNEIGMKSTHRMLKNVIVNAIQYYDETRDGKVIDYVLGKVIEVMSR